jgi:hypothetical protein
MARDGESSLDFAHRHHDNMVERWQNKNPEHTFEQRHKYIIESWKYLTRGLDLTEEVPQHVQEEIERKRIQEQEQERMERYHKKMLEIQEEHLALARERERREWEQDQERKMRQSY